MNPRELPDFEGDVIHGKERTFYSVRIIVLCMAVAACVSGAVSIPIVLVLSHDASNRSYKADVKACENRNLGRADLNERLVTQRRDAKNLGDLAQTMSEVRTSEAEAFTEMGKAFEIEKEVAPLIKVLKDASSDDKRIADEQARVHFKDAEQQNCKSERAVPKQ